MPNIGKGNVSINHYLCIYDVLLVPSFRMNLLSVKKLCCSGFCQVTFNSTCVFPDTTSKGDWFWKSLLSAAYPTCVITVSLGSSSSTTFEWHLCLGHSSLNKLKLMFPSFQNIYQLRCESCELSKHSHASLRPRVPKLQNIMELLNVSTKSDNPWSICLLPNTTCLRLFSRLAIWSIECLAYLEQWYALSVALS